MKTDAYIALNVLETLSGRAEVSEAMVKLCLCETLAERGEVAVDNVIDELLDAGYVRSSVSRFGVTWIPVLSLTEAGARQLAA